MQAARIFSANYNGESIVETQRRHHVQPESLFVLLLNSREYRRRIFLDRIVQNRGQRCSRIFHLHIYSAGQKSLLANICARQIKAAFDAQMRSCFQMLRDNFSKKRLLGEIFGPNDDSVAP